VRVTFFHSVGYCGIHGLSPIARRGSFIRARSNLYTVAVRDSSTNIPLAADKAQEDDTILHQRPIFRAMQLLGRVAEGLHPPRSQNRA
jgi:hypothetical protein